MFCFCLCLLAGRFFVTVVARVAKSPDSSLTLALNPNIKTRLSQKIQCPTERDLPFIGRIRTAGISRPLW